LDPVGWLQRRILSVFVLRSFILSSDPGQIFRIIPDSIVDRMGKGRSDDKGQSKKWNL
jgi:hypothetical protein